MRGSKHSAYEYQVGKAKQREQLGVVFREYAIARLAMLKQALHCMKTMLDFRAYTGLGFYQFLSGATLRIFPGRFAHARAHRNVPFDCLVRVLRELCNVLIARIAQHGLFAAVQQRVAWTTSDTLPAVPTTEWGTARSGTPARAPPARR